MKIAKIGLVLLVCLMLIAGVACTSQYTLATSSTTGGSVTAPGQPGPFIYAAGTAVNIVATPNSGYYFVNWTGSTGTIANPNVPSTTITMNGNYSVTANFAPIRILTTASSQGGSVTSPGQPGPFQFNNSQVVNIVATPNTGYHFVNWTGNTATIANPNVPSTTITMNGNYSVTANFAMEPNTVYIKDIATISRGNQFTAVININEVQYLTYAAFDIQFNSSLISYVSIASGNISGIAATVSSNIMQPGLLRMVVDFSDYANSNSGNGINGSGSLCSVTFNADVTGTSNISFVAGQGAPQGELTLIKFVSYSQDTINNVNWLNNKIVITSP
jgi:uncharacterized repeat protein (TIGR02543 family)